MKKTLIYGYGNPGRQDDGLGVLLVEAIEKWAGEQGLENLSFDNNYQLNIEDAANIAAYERVIFADASQEEIDSFSLTRVEPSAKVEFTMHAVSPAFIVHLCESIYQKTPECLLLHIRGYEWEFARAVTPNALENLEKSIEFMIDYLLKD
jgi:hydrogenase maturation protease